MMKVTQNPQWIPKLEASLFASGMDMAISKLNNGGWVHIFPEGSRSKDGGVTMRSAKRGVGRLILDADSIPIVIPFVHYGMQEIMLIGAKFPRIGKTVTVLIGDPIDFDDILDVEGAEHVPRGKLYDAVSKRVGHHFSVILLCPSARDDPPRTRQQNQHRYAAATLPVTENFQVPTLPREALETFVDCVASKGSATTNNAPSLTTLTFLEVGCFRHVLHPCGKTQSAQSSPGNIIRKDNKQAIVRDLVQPNFSKMKELAERRNLEDLTIAPVLTFTTKVVLEHMNKLLEIPGPKLLFGGKVLENRICTIF